VAAVTLEFLARLTGGRVVGPASTVIHWAAPLPDADPRAIALLDDCRRVEEAVAKDVAALVVREPAPECRTAEGRAIPVIVVRDPHAAFAAIVAWFRPPLDRHLRGISPTAAIDPTVRLGVDVAISHHAVVGADCQIGDGSQLYPNVVVMEGCSIGRDVVLMPGVVLYPRTVIEDRVLIHAQCVIGAYGFGYRTEHGEHRRAAQLGHVHIESDVEIGACTTIDRGTYGSTRIGRGTKIDNHVMIAHNCRIGRHNLICSQVGIAGSCQTGDYVVLAGQVGLRDHVRLGDGAIVGAQAGVMNDLEGGTTYLGSPATPQRAQMQIFAAQQRLPEMRRLLKQLHQLVEQFDSRRDGRSGPQAA